MKHLHFIQVYKQAPWRERVRIASVTLLILVSLAIVAGFYLSVSAQIASAGIEIQKMDEKRSELNQEIADSQIKLAVLTSSTEMAKRARILGFNYASTENALYVVVPGYTSPIAAVMEQKSAATTNEQVIIKDSYQQSLWDWIVSNVMQADALLEEN